MNTDRFTHNNLVTLCTFAQFTYNELLDSLYEWAGLNESDYINGSVQNVVETTSLVLPRHFKYIVTANCLCQQERDIPFTYPLLKELNVFIEQSVGNLQSYTDIQYVVQNTSISAEELIELGQVCSAYSAFFALHN